MPTLDKNQQMLDYIMGCSVIAENPLYFNFANERDNSNQILVTRDDVMVNKPYIDGSVLKQYTVDVLLYKSVAYNPIVLDETPGGEVVPSQTYIDENLVDMRDGQALIDWILEQNDAMHFPNFGDKCIIESVEPTANKPILNGVNSNIEPPLAQYSVGIKVEYLDISKQLWM